MIQKDKKMEEFESKLSENNSPLEKIVYSDAILLLEKDINPDKVQNWVNNVLQSFYFKPKPLSDNEKKKQLEKAARKIDKFNKLGKLNAKIKMLFNEYGILFIGFFDWKELSESEYNLLMKVVTDNGLYFDDCGDGAFNPFVSKKKLDSSFKKTYNDINDEISDMSVNKTVIDDYIIFDLSKFRDKISKIILTKN